MTNGPISEERQKHFGPVAHAAIWKRLVKWDAEGIRLGGRVSRWAEMRGRIAQRFTALIAC